MFTLVHCVCLFSFLASSALGNNALQQMSCGTVAEVFEKRVGTADSVPATPIPDAVLAECSGTLTYTSGKSCCTSDMESKFWIASEEYLHEHIRMSNTKLKSRITESLSLYQDHLKQSMQDAQTKTSDILASLYKIPKEVHKKALNGFFDQLNQFLLGNNEHRLPDIINNFFTNLFPSVFEYVLSDPSKAKQTGVDFDNCLKENHNEIEPFGNVPKHLGSRVKYAFQRARIFTETLEVMIHAIDSTDNVMVDNECKKAVSRLQFCSMCSGQMEARPCRGLCLNVMRGCLSKLSDISSAWDDLVVEFENLEMGMFKQNNAQEIMSYLDGNITEALLQAMDDGPRIYSDVMAKCRESQSRSESDMMFKRFSTPEGIQPSHPSTRIHSIRKDIQALLAQLEDSKGFFHRIADGLCRVSVIYDQEMQSDQCWNGTTVGRYMQPVPEANMISQVQHNTEVKVSLIPDRNLLTVKDLLEHMRRNLSALFNEELMLSDQSYTSIIDGSGGGYSAGGGDVINDDEDFINGASGSGSGKGPSTDDEEDRHTTTTIAQPGDKTGRPSGGGSKVPGGATRPGERPGSGDKPRDSATASAVSFTLLCVCAMLSWIHTVL